jgi:hypothetical protein
MGGDQNSDQAWVNVGGNQDPDEAWVKVVGGARRAGRMKGAAMSGRYSGFDTSSPQEGQIAPSETTALLGTYSESGKQANDQAW